MCNLEPFISSRPVAPLGFSNRSTESVITGSHWGRKESLTHCQTGSFHRSFDLMPVANQLLPGPTTGELRGRRLEAAVKDQRSEPADTGDRCQHESGRLMNQGQCSICGQACIAATLSIARPSAARTPSTSASWRDRVAPALSQVTCRMRSRPCMSRSIKLLEGCKEEIPTKRDSRNGRVGFPC